MATVRGPLNSLSAQGQLGKALIYQKGSKGTHVKAFATPRQTKSIDQKYTKARLKIASIIWGFIAEEYQNEWANEAQRQGLTKQNAMIQSNIERLTAGAYPLASPNYPATQPSPFLTSIIGQIYKGRAVISGNIFGTLDSQDIVMLRVWPASVSEINDAQQISEIQHTPAGSGLLIWLNDYQPGNYQVRALLARPNGTIKSATNSVAITIP